MRRYLTRYRLPAEINLGCRVLWECVSVCVCECGVFLRIFFFFFKSLCFNSFMPERQVTHFSPSTPALPWRAAGPTLHPHGRGRWRVPSPLASSYIIPSMDVFLISESGQGCRFLRDNSTTDILGPSSPIPAQKYFFFWKEMWGGGRQRWHPAGPTGPSAPVLPFAILSLDPQLTPHRPHCCSSAPCPSSMSPISPSPTSSRNWRRALRPSHRSSPHPTCPSAPGTSTWLCLYSA